jgi:sugar phosphate permease
MASRLGGAIAPWLVIPLQQAYGWRASFFFLGMMGMAWALIWYAWYRDTPGENPELLGTSWRKSASRYQLLTRASRGGSHCAAEICG